jgi:Domain of unknown function (DUF6362)
LNTHIEQLKLIIRDAWRTLSMLPDPDARFRRMFGRSWPLPVVRDPNTEYGATPASWLGTPTAREITDMERVLVWLVWLRGEEGEFAISRVSAWSMGTSLWKIAQREHCSERTVSRRIDRSVKKIGVQFRDEIAKIISRFNVDGAEISPVDEAEAKPERIRGFGEKANADAPENLEPGRVYADGNMRFRGEKYKSAYDVDDKSLGKRRR